MAQHVWRQAWRFIIAGLTSVSVYYASLYTLTDLLLFWYLASAVLAAIPQHIVNFILMKVWAFENKDRSRIGKQLWSYAKVSVFSFALNVSLLYSFVEYLGLWYIHAQIIVTGIIGLFTFILYRVVFRK